MNEIGTEKMNSRLTTQNYCCKLYSKFITRSKIPPKEEHLGCVIFTCNDQRKNLSAAINSRTMSSGGGISRFASRKHSSTTTNEDNSTAVALSEGNQTVDTKAKFSFGSFNENSDALSTTSDDEFGFLGGGGSSIGGDDFFMMDDCGYNHDHDGVDEVSGDYSTSTTEVSVEQRQCGFLLNSALLPH